MQDKTGTCLSFCPTIMSFMLFRQRGSACAADIVLHAGYLQDRYPNSCLHFLRAMYLPYPCNHMLARYLIFLRCLLVLTTSDLFSQANNILFFPFLPRHQAWKYHAMSCHSRHLPNGRRVSLSARFARRGHSPVMPSRRSRQSKSFSHLSLCGLAATWVGILEPMLVIAGKGDGQALTG